MTAGKGRNMSEFVIFTDSTADLPAALADELELRILPFSFRLDGHEYRNYADNRELSPKEFYDALRDGKQSSTSLVTYFMYHEAFESCLKEGKDILYLCFSSGLSGSYEQALRVAADLKTAYPERKTEVLDTLCASLGQGLFAYYAAKEKQKGRSIDEVRDYAKALIPRLCHWFSVTDLGYLRRGGRLSGASAFVGTILGIKPILHLDDDGKIIPVDKVRGREKSLEELAQRMTKTMLADENPVIFISHGDAEADAKRLAEIIKAQTGLESFVINEIGPVVGAHSGPGTIALFFVGEKR
jgi:DegV family protein with EDD domain